METRPFRGGFGLAWLPVDNIRFGDLSISGAVGRRHDFVEALRRVPAVVGAALVDGDEGADLWVVVDADPVAAGRSVVPTIGELLKTHPTAIADFLVLPSRGRPARSLLPPEARALFVREAV